jgi:hypothetical protein
VSNKTTISVTITGDASKLRRAAEEAGGTIVDLDKKGSSSFKNIRDSATGFLAADGVQALMSFGGELLGLGSQLEAMKVKSKTVFGDSYKDVAEWADGVNESLGLSDDAVVGMAANMADLLKPMGFNEKQAADLSKQFVDLSGALSAWSGGTKSAAEVSEIMSDALLGETDGLKQLGISISAAEVEQRAMVMTGKASADALTAQEKALATQALILEKSTDAQTAWNDGSMDGIKKSNEMKASWEDLKAQMAEKLLPAAQAVTAWIVDDFIPGAQATAAWINENIVPALVSMGRWINENIVPALQDFGRFIRDDVVPALVVIGKFINEKVIPPLAALTEFWIKLQLKVAEVYLSVTTKVDDLVEFFIELPGRLADIGEGMFDFIKESFKSAINFVIDGWNSLEFKIPGFDPPGPGPKFGGFTLGMPDIPRLAAGAVVMPSSGGSLVNVAEGGEPEMVLPLSKARQMGFGGDSGGYYIDLRGASVYGLDDLDRKLEDSIARLKRRGSPALAS